MFYRALQDGNNAFIQGHFRNDRFYDGQQSFGQVTKASSFVFKRGLIAALADRLLSAQSGK